jgi:hypothetical protein
MGIPITGRYGRPLMCRSSVMAADLEWDLGGDRLAGFRLAHVTSSIRGGVVTAAASGTQVITASTAEASGRCMEAIASRMRELR